METKVIKSRGIGFCGILAIIFIVLKLCGIGAVAQWSWLWVLSPIWIPWALIIVGLLILGAIAVACHRYR